MSFVALAALGSAVAALVHAAAAGSHGDVRSLVLLFGACAVAQAAWAALAVTVGKRSRLVLVGGVVLNGAAVAAWVFSRTTGLPLVDALAEAESVGTQDLAAAVAGAVAAIAAGLAAMGSERLRLVPLPRPAAALATIGAMAIGFTGMTATHTHTGHTHGDEATHTHEGDEASHSHDGELAAGPVISVDDPRVTAEQQTAAQALIDSTRAGMAGFTDVASVEAAGYRSIGDGLTGHEHFINYEYIGDEAELDPQRIESVVFEVGPDGSKAVVSAMYIMRPGSTMDDVPDIAGELTTWHDHQNLCWSTDGRVVGLLINGRCRPDGVFRPTPPMLHVWMVDHPCGPFAGLDGHGADGDSCAHTH